MINFLPTDELNAFTDDLEGMDEAEAIDRVLDLLTLAYTRGNAAANEMLATEEKPSLEKMFAVIFLNIAGKTFVDRVREHFANGDLEAIKRVAETDMHRVYAEAETDTAKQSGKQVVKVWRTMGDARVRDTHNYLEGMQAKLGEAFYTFDGDSAEQPGGFSMAQNNCNCRCTLELIEV